MTPTMQAAGWLLVPVIALGLFLVRQASALPGSWGSAIGDGMQNYASRWIRGSVVRSNRALRWLLCLLLCIGLAGLKIDSTYVPPVRDLHGRFLLLDMAGNAAPADQIFLARQLAARAAAIPTGVMALSADAFDVVPLTDDNRQLDRYLAVLSPDVMPLPGRSLSAGINRARTAFSRAGILAGQIVVLTGGELPDPPQGASQDQFPVVLIPSNAPAAKWESYASALGAKTLPANRLDELDEDLSRARIRQENNARPANERHHSAMLFALLCMPLWLWLFFRRSRR